MGVDIRLILPHDVHLHNVSKVIGILAGGKAVKVNFDSGTGWYTDVKNIKVRDLISKARG